MIKETLKTHGDRQIEIKRRVGFDKPQEELKYHIETWFFFPTTLQINRWTFPAPSFPQYLKTYIRLRPPSATLASLLDPGKELDDISRCLDKLIAEGDREGETELADQYEKALKLFCMVYRRAVRLAVKDALRTNKTPEQRSERARRYQAQISEILDKYRSMATRDALIASRLRSPAFSYCDEYLAIITTHYCFKLLGALKEGGAKDEFRQFWRQEMLYRADNYHASLAISGQDNELPLYRWSVLKKYVNAPLFLEIRRKGGQTFMFHVITSIAAAFAMIFATAVAFIWQMRHGAVSAPLFLALVIGYIFKDKMKELSREKMFSVFRRWLPDRRLVIYKDIDRPIGHSEEAFLFVDDKKLPDDIRQLRNKSHLVDILNSFRSEDILYYSKTVSLKNLDNMFFTDKRSIVDITRLDISPFFRHVDNIGEELPTLDEEDVIREDKTYHINIIRRITTNDQQPSESIERMRVVITHNGIKRIEEVLKGNLDQRGEVAPKDRKVLSQRASTETEDLSIGSE